MRKLACLYDYLTPWERFRLTLEALARDDREELERLGGTCPQGTYRLRDPAFTSLVEASRWAAFAFALAWAEAWANYRIAWVTVEAFRAATEAFAGTAQDPPANLAELLGRREGELRLLWQGFAAFCNDRGLDPEAVLAWWPPVLDRVRREREWLQAPAPAEEVEAAREVFAAVWERVAG